MTNFLKICDTYKDESDSKRIEKSPSKEVKSFLSKVVSKRERKYISFFPFPNEMLDA